MCSGVPLYWAIVISELPIRDDPDKKEPNRFFVGVPPIRGDTGRVKYLFGPLILLVTPWQAKILFTSLTQSVLSLIFVSFLEATGPTTYSFDCLG